MTINKERQEPETQTPVMEGSFSNVANPIEVNPEIVPVETSLPQAPENATVSEIVPVTEFSNETEIYTPETPTVDIGYPLSEEGSDQQEIAYQHAMGVEIDSNQA